MKLPSIRMTGLLLLNMGWMSAAHAEPVTYAGRGVHHFETGSACPFAGEAQARDCNRIVLDGPDVQASVDKQAHTIVLSSEVGKHGKEVLADLLLQASGVSASGVRVPLRVRVLLRRDGQKWDADLYTHAPVRGKFSQVQLDMYSVRVKQGNGNTGAEQEVLSPQKAVAMLEQPSFAARFARNFVQVAASDAKQPSGDDIKIGLGLQRLNKSVARARFSSDAPAGSQLDAALASGNWAIQLDFLSSQIPRWVAQRELFTLGLENSSLVKNMREQGFQKHDHIELGTKDGKPYLRVNDQQEDFPGAQTSAKLFFQESFIGLILGWSRFPYTVNVALASGKST